MLRASGEMVEYDPANFAAKQTVKLPVEAAKSPASISVNGLGQMLFAPTVTLPLSEEDAAAGTKSGYGMATLQPRSIREFSARSKRLDPTKP